MATRMRTFKSTDKAGMWYLVVGAQVVEAWAWNGQNDPPKTLNEDGWRYRVVGQQPCGKSKVYDGSRDEIGRDTP